MLGSLDKTVASAPCAQERGVKELRCVVRFSTQAAAAAVIASACLSLLPPLSTTDRDLEDTGRGVRLPTVVDFSQLFAPYGRDRLG